MRKIFTLFVAALCCATMFAEDYALPGKFTVNADGAQVRFSLQSIATDNGRVGVFLPNNELEQYRRVYTDLSYFAWGTGDDPNFTSYKTSFVDWGDYLLDSDGNPIEQQFRTLSANEWQYLLSGRENATSLCGLAQINHEYLVLPYYKGLMLFPDDAYAFAVSTGNKLKFSDDLEFKSYKGTNNTFRYGDNEYTYEQWKQLEAHGAVFLQVGIIFMNNLPNGTTAMPEYSEWKDVIYWTSTGAGGTLPSAKALWINEYSYNKVNNILVTQPRNYQLLVRLVHDVQAGEGIENIATPADKARKVMMDGQLYIATPDGAIYDAQGTKVK